MGTGNVILSTSKLSRTFLERPVLREVSVAFHANSCALLIGANGAGKSTLLRLCSGMLSASAGEVLYHSSEGGRNLKAIPHPQRATLRSYLGHDSQLYSQLSVQENFILRAKILGLSASLETLTRWGLEKHRHKATHSLSKGMTQRLALACCLLQPAQAILLDEPTSNLDDDGVQALVQQLSERMLSGASIIIASHDLARLSTIASRAVLLDQGKLHADSENAASLDAVIHIYRELNR